MDIECCQINIVVDMKWLILDTSTKLSGGNVECLQDHPLLEGCLFLLNFGC